MLRRLRRFEALPFAFSVFFLTTDFVLVSVEVTTKRTTVLRNAVYIFRKTSAANTVKFIGKAIFRNTITYRGDRWREVFGTIHAIIFSVWSLNIGLKQKLKVGRRTVLRPCMLAAWLDACHHISPFCFRQIIFCSTLGENVSSITATAQHELPFPASWTVDVMQVCHFVYPLLDRPTAFDNLSQTWEVTSHCLNL